MILLLSLKELKISPAYNTGRDSSGTSRLPARRSAFGEEATTEATTALGRLGTASEVGADSPMAPP